MVKLFHPAALAVGGMSVISFPGSVPLRAARAADHAALAALSAEAFAQGAVALVPAGLRAGADAARFRALFAAGGPLLLAEDDEGRPLGCILAEPAIENGTARLTGLWVAPQAAGQGIGSALLEAMEALLAAEGAAVLRLRVPGGNLRALGLFRRRGYAMLAAGQRSEPVLRVQLPHCMLAKPLPAPVSAAA
ncbi:GNAT family N-acetyltransferase [Roseomonas sp. E05]|uniref:GNAT family N-acetyltransferase n=1 Tax=Roseomonas sp. E05 TaxID=3046310 RepID=UPI0024B9CEAE|nr:GNAT family N-acetyltransferase [Roseomonas sp. E05]MDJ0388197.1 GNAT family N-acetyltransferase [Roseomonas sp. E05]